MAGDAPDCGYSLPGNSCKSARASLSLNTLLSLMLSRTSGACSSQADGAPALGYFKEPGLPQCLCGIPLEYSARAVGWLRAHPGR